MSREELQAKAEENWKQHNVCKANGLLTRAKRHEIIARCYEKQAEKYDLPED